MMVCGVHGMMNDDNKTDFIKAFGAGSNTLAPCKQFVEEMFADKGKGDIV